MADAASSIDAASSADVASSSGRTEGPKPTVVLVIGDLTACTINRHVPESGLSR